MATGPATIDRKTDPQVADDGDSVFLGVNNRLAADKLSAGFLFDAENCRMRSGEAATRLGVTKPGWVNDTTGGGTVINAPGTFYAAGAFKDPNGFEWVMEAAAGSVYRHKAHNTRVQVPLPTGVQIFSRSSFVQAFNKLFIFRGRHVAPLVLADVDTGFTDIEPHWSASATYKAAILATGQVADEMAYGPFIAVTSVTSMAGVATATTTNPHGYVTGADVTISGASPATYNGRFNITVVNDSVFTYVMAHADTSPATSTITCSNMALYWKARGSRVTLTTLTHSTTTATATKATHGFTTGQYVTIAGATPAAYNGTFVITVTGANTFTFVMATDPSADATGTVTAQTSLVLAGQSPDTNAEAWQQLFNVLPNADDALYINNQLLVPTAYTPGVSGFDVNSTYTKKDYLVAMNYLDPVHFDFVDDFRINAGSSDEIQCLVKYAADVAVCFKDNSFAIISNISLDLTQLSVDMHIGYGATGVRSAVAAGQNIIFASKKRGICSLLQNQLGQVRSVDIPFSNDIPAIIGRINWNYADQIRLAWWDDKLYAAVPLDDATVPDRTRIVTDTFGPDTPENFEGHYFSDTYTWSPTGLGGGAISSYLSSRGLAAVISDGDHWILVWPFPQANSYTSDVTGLWTSPNGPAPVFNFVRKTGCNNAILVYDFRTGQTQVLMGQTGTWNGADTGDAVGVVEFFKATYNGIERLYFAGTDGYVSLMEEGQEGDEVFFGASDSTLAFIPVADKRVTRGYTFDTEAQKRFNAVQLVAGTWDPQFSLARGTGAANSSAAVLTDKTFSRTAYLRPFDKAPYVATNVNGDFATAGRGDYSVPLTASGFYCAGASTEQFQEITVRETVRPLVGRYVQYTVTNDSGRFNLKSIAPTTSEGQRRSGIMI